MIEILGKKIGMTHVFKENGKLLPLTLIKIYENCVLEKKKIEKLNETKDLIIIGFEKQENLKKVKKPNIGTFNKAKISVHNKIKSFETKESYKIEVGKNIPTEDILKEGKKINVRGRNIGKGFAGSMKRWNFRGLEASHGVSISHRSHGSTGQRQDPGKTFRGKKMAGHMGHRYTSIRNLAINSFDKNKMVLSIVGSLPGKSGTELTIKVS